MEPPKDMALGGGEDHLNDRLDAQSYVKLQFMIMCSTIRFIINKIMESKSC